MTSFEYRLVDRLDDMFFVAVQQRETISQSFSSMRRTTLQKVYEVIHFRLSCEKTRGPMSALQVSELYGKSVTYADNSEQISDSFVDSALSLGTRVPCLCPRRALHCRLCSL